MAMVFKNPINESIDVVQVGSIMRKTLHLFSLKVKVEPNEDNIFEVLGQLVSLFLLNALK